MPAMSVGGLASGLDTNSIIAQLTALEQSKVTREQQKKTNAESTLEKFKDLQTRLGNLAQKAAALETPEKFNVFKALSNYEEYATISGKEGATAGQYEVVVHQLASSTKIASNKIDAINTPLVSVGDQDTVFGAGNDTLKISITKTEAAAKNDPRNPNVEIVINKSDTLKDIVNKINAAEGAGVTASIMTMANGDNRLVLTAVETGTKGFNISEDGGSSFLQYIGILSGSDGESAASSNALVTKEGAATGGTKFSELNTILQDEIEDGDRIGVFVNGAWITASLGSINNTIDDVLNGTGGLNEQLEDLNLKARLNEAGEIILETLDGTPLDNPKDIKVKIGDFDGSDFVTTKRDLGNFASRNTFANVINEGKNAFYTIDGMAISSQSNSDDKTITGTVFTLKKVSAPGMEHIKLSLELDKDGIMNNISAFIEEYNSLIKFIDENMKASVKEEKDEVTGQKKSTRTVGAFTGDSNISSLRETLRQMFTGTIDQLTDRVDNGYSTVYSSISRLGIITEKDGTLGVDRDKLSKALTADFEGVRKLFTTNWFSSEPGFSVGRAAKDAQTGVYDIVFDSATDTFTVNGQPATRNSNILTYNGISFEVPDGGGTAKVTYIRGIAGMLTNFVEKAKNTVDGYYKQAEKTYQARIDSIQKRVDELQVRVDNYNKRLVTQYASLERSMSNLQSQTANMMSALGSLNR
jgi:flagellar hook-associated protein 2